MDRLENERRFHDERFGAEADLRAELGKYYSVYGINTSFFEGLLGRYAPGADVLEYGCAKGDKSLRWAREGARIKGIDISGKAVDIANERARAEKLPAQFYAMNAEQLELPDASFDVVFGEGILHHLDLTKACREIARVLRPQGRAIFVEPLGHNPVFNLYRKLTPKMRTDDEHPLVRSDLELMRRYFAHVEVKYFHLATLAAVPLRGKAVFEPLLSLLHTVDEAVMKLASPVRYWAWIAVIEMAAPRA
jgi:ubiquinone/menaquinone biosynthesis C-methylase UbiE